MNVQIALSDNLYDKVSNFIMDALYQFRYNGVKQDEIIIMMPKYMERLIEFVVRSQFHSVYLSPDEAIHRAFQGIKIYYNGYENRCIVYWPDCHLYPENDIQPKILELNPEYLKSATA